MNISREIRSGDLMKWNKAKKSWQSSGFDKFRVIIWATIKFIHFDVPFIHFTIFNFSGMDSMVDVRKFFSLLLIQVAGCLDEQRSKHIHSIVYSCNWWNCMEYGMRGGLINWTIEHCFISFIFIKHLHCMMAKYWRQININNNK